MLMSEDTRYSYNEYVKMMYQKGYYVGPYYINLMSDEVYCIENRILIVPAYVEGEDKVYVFTGMSQKATTLSEPTEFKLYLEDTDGHEFRDGDNVMLSLVRPNDVVNLYTRNYATWKFGVMFDKGVHLDPDKYLMFRAQKEIGTFDIDIINVDLFRHKKKVERKYDRMMWLE
jgi:hypothetical protein